MDRSNPSLRISCLAAVIGLLLLVSACSEDKEPGALGVHGGGGLFGSNITRGPSCPQAAVLDEPGDLIRFSETSAGGISSILFRASLDLVESYCEIDRESVDVTVTLELKVVRGPANTTGEAPFAYFVAVLDDQKNVIFRTKFPIIVKFTKQETRIAFSEDFAIRIDIGDDLEPADYLVYLGFEMTPAELAFSRERRRR